MICEDVAGFCLASQTTIFIMFKCSCEKFCSLLQAKKRVCHHAVIRLQSKQLKCAVGLLALGLSMQDYRRWVVQDLK